MRVVIFAERVRTLKWLREPPAGRPQARPQAGGHPARRPDRPRAAGRRRKLQEGLVAHPRADHRRPGQRGREPARAVPRAHPLRHPVVPDQDRAAQRPHRPLRPAAPAADHDAAAQPRDRGVLRRPAGAQPPHREGARGAHRARRRRVADGQVRRRRGRGRDPQGPRREGAAWTTSCRRPQAVKAENSIAGMLARIMAGAATAPGASPAPADDATAQSSLYPSQVAFLRGRPR